MVVDHEKLPQTVKKHLVCVGANCTLCVASVYEVLYVGGSTCVFAACFACFASESHNVAGYSVAVSVDWCMCVYRVASHNSIFADGCIDWFHTAERRKERESKRESQTEKTECSSQCCRVLSG